MLFLSSLPQNDFRKEGEESSNLVVMHRTYHFLHTLADSLLAFILTRCGRSTNIILLRQDGGVFQSGAVQTMVRKQMKGNGEIILKWLGVSMCHACIDLLDPCSVLYWCVMLQFCIKVSWQCFVLMFCTHVLYCVCVSKFCVLYQSVVAMLCFDVLYPCFVLCWCAMPMLCCHPVLSANILMLESYRSVSVLCLSPPSCVASKYHDAGVLPFCLCSVYVTSIQHCQQTP